MTQRSAHAYYGFGGLYGGLYGAGLYGYGGSLYGYGGLYGLYGLGGMYGLYGGLYGGLGLYGLYGLGGLGLYGLYGLYGGLYGGLGLYGLGGLGYPYDLTRYYLSNGSEALGRTADVLLTGGGGTSLLLPALATTVAVTPTVTITVPVYPDPTGIYYGSWTSVLTSTTNVMTMNLVYDILTVSVTGTAGLLSNKLIPVAINVAGTNNAPTFTLSGNYFDPLSLVTYSLTLTCTFSAATLTLPAIIQGSYLIHDPLFLKTDAGTFSVGRL